MFGRGRNSQGGKSAAQIGAMRRRQRSVRTAGLVPQPSTRTIAHTAPREWLSRMDKDAKETRTRRIFEAWLACRIGAEIAEVENCDEKTVTNVVSGISEDLPEFQKVAANHAVDFDIPVYNVWKQQTQSAGSKHFGNSEIRWLDNLLYLYTKPFDVMVDPFAGGGSTIDLCRRRFRRSLWSSRDHPELSRLNGATCHS